MSLRIGEHIAATLRKDRELMHAVGGRVFPIAATGSAALPYIAFRRTSVAQERTKDGHCTDTVGAQIAVVGKDYAEAVALIDRVREDLARAVYVEYSTGYEVTEARLQDNADAEMWDEAQAAYVEQIGFVFETEY